MNLLHQPMGLEPVLPERRTESAGRRELTSLVLLVNDLSVQIPQRSLQDIENEVGLSSTRFIHPAARGVWHLLLPLDPAEVVEHLPGRAEKGHLAPVVEKQSLVKELEKPGAGLVDADDDDLVVRQAANQFEDVL